MMTRLTMEGGAVLNGCVAASGAKNAALPILAACIMFEGDTSLTNVPFLNDVSIMIRMLNALGVHTEYYNNDEVKISNYQKVRHIAPYELVTAMRASFFVAGPILARTGFAKVPLPGGCSIGARPVDIHLKGFRELGADISMEHGFVQLHAKRLKGANITLDFPSVGATENLMMAACLSEGETCINNAAREPEIDDLAHILIAAGGQISGVGTSCLTIQGVPSLKGVKNYRVIPDRVEAGTLLIAGAITGGDVTVTDMNPIHLSAVLRVMKQCGIDLEVGEDWVRVKPSGRPNAVGFSTEPHPGFPTDMQAQMMTLLCVADGESVVEEHIFENRFMHARELMRMGAKISLSTHKAIITGVPTLSGAEVQITDLRAGAALILAGLVAQGRTTVYGMKHLKRGYYNLPGKLESLGATFIK